MGLASFNPRKKNSLKKPNSKLSDRRISCWCIVSLMRSCPRLVGRRGAGPVRAAPIRSDSLQSGPNGFVSKTLKLKTQRIKDDRLITKSHRGGLAHRWQQISPQSRKSARLADSSVHAIRLFSVIIAARFAAQLTHVKSVNNHTTVLNGGNFIRMTSFRRQHLKTASWPSSTKRWKHLKMNEFRQTKHSVV